MDDKASNSDPLVALVARVKGAGVEDRMGFTKGELQLICNRAEEFWAAVTGEPRTNLPTDTNTGPNDHYI